jgi:hypothetical protein
MRAMVEQLAQQGAPDVSSLVEHDRSIAFPTTRNRSVEQPSRATPLTQNTRYSGHLHDLGRRHVGPGSADNIKIVHSESQCGASCRACLPKKTLARNPGPPCDVYHLTLSRLAR